MPVFHYKGRTETGEAVEGTCQAESRQAAAAELRESGIWLTGLEDVSASGPRATGWHPLYALWPIGKGPLAACFRQLAALFKAGVAPAAAFDALQERVGSGRLRRVLRRMRDQAATGKTLSGAMAEFDHVFGPFAPAMLAVGERTGRLDVVCEQVADQYETEMAMDRATMLQRLYFWVLLVVALPLPKLNLLIDAESFANGVQRYTDHLTHVILPIYVGLLVGGQALRLGLNARPLWGVRDWLALHNPLTGGIRWRAAMARFARTAAAMYEAGVPPADAAEAAALATGSRPISRAILPHAYALRHQGTLSGALAASGQLSGTEVGVIATGEESGTLPEGLTKLAERFESEKNMRMKVLGTSALLLTLAAGAVLVLWFGAKGLVGVYERMFEVIFEDI
ncbi:MAG: type II secretion system F family protein [Armatimonadota bacterium]